MKYLRLAALCAAMTAAACAPEYRQEESFTMIIQRGGRTLGVGPEGQTVESGRFIFKDLNRNGVLDPYEDWRLPARERAVDLASRMTPEEIAGLMVYSSHQAIDSASLTAYHGEAVSNGIRHFLVTRVSDPATAARWSNSLQALCEASRLGIPANNSSDPRHGTISDDEFNLGAGGRISVWPGLLGMAATFDPAIALRFGEVASAEYRALGLTTTLSPQVDLATEPRWRRVFATFGEGPLLAADIARAYTDGFQTSRGRDAIEGAWGLGSVNAMAKHWPGGGTGESGRDAHFAFGKYAVYPGGNFEMHLLPFVDGAFRLEGGTGKASAVMPYYTVSCGVNPSGENVANAYSEYLIKDLLRDKYAYDGVICTDWGVVQPYTAVNTNNGKPWGLESLPGDELCFRALMNSVDQFGGIQDPQYILGAYRLGVGRLGEEAMTERFRESAVRLLVNIFRTGVFENPYLVPEESAAIAGCEEFMKEGFDAQVKSVVMLKNAGGALPLKEKTRIYVPKRKLGAELSYWSGKFKNSESEVFPVSLNLLGRYYEFTDSPENAEAAVIFIEGPLTQRGYDPRDVEKGGNGYLPMSLQYADYTATEAREVSLAGGDPLESFTNRSYKGKTSSVRNSADAIIVRATREAIGPDKPLILIVSAQRPLCFGEIEPYADAILLGFEVQNQAFLEIVSGRREPSGLLPVQMPLDMRAVELQEEDRPFDMECYTDSQGSIYDYAFGLGWSGRIADWRTERYSHSL